VHRRGGGARASKPLRCARTARRRLASALHYAGYTVPEAAERMGHEPALHVETYAHVIKQIKGTRYDDLNGCQGFRGVPRGFRKRR
jgi:transposase